MMLPAFFRRVKPVSTMANPACMKKTSAVPQRTQIVLTDDNIAVSSLFYCKGVMKLHFMTPLSA